MHYEIEGVIAQTLHLALDEGETAWAANGSIVILEEGIEWRLKVPGGVGGALKRSFAGEGMSLTFVESRRDGARAVLGAKHPGKIAVWDLADGPMLATRGAFMAAVGDVNIGVTVAQRVGAAFFGGAGLFLQEISGKGLVFVHGAGDFLDLRLSAGEKIQVSSGNLAAFADTVDYRIRGVGGCVKMIFGREGVFMTELEGPGRVLLQSLKRVSGAKQAASAAASAVP
jgi:uncharacterized protein (TIGR00266 family)